MIVVVEPVFTVVTNKDVGPAVIIVVGNRASISPAVVRDSGASTHVSKGTIVIVMEQSRVRGLLLTVQRVERGTVHEVNVGPAVIVKVDQTDPRAVGLNNNVLFWRPHPVSPARQPRLLRDVLKDDWTVFNKSTSGYGALFLVIYRSGRFARGDSTGRAVGLRLWRLLLRAACSGLNQRQNKNSTE